MRWSRVGSYPDQKWPQPQSLLLAARQVVVCLQPEAERRGPCVRGQNQTTIAVREKRTDLPFRIPATVHPELTTI